MRGAIYHFDGWTINYDFLTASKGDECLSIAPKEMDALIYLIESDGSMVYREDIILQVWGKLIPTDHALDNMIYKIRSKLKTSALKTVNKRGYYVKGGYIVSCDE